MRRTGRSARWLRKLAFPTPRSAECGRRSACSRPQPDIQAVERSAVRRQGSAISSPFTYPASASAISAINKQLDASLKAFCERKLKEPFPYLILDAGYERIRVDGIITSHAVLLASGLTAKAAVRCWRSSLTCSFLIFVVEPCGSFANFVPRKLRF